ncbi:MAG: glycosyltransferase [Leptolyngbyaceae bacterium]|nr:glycosyltransferase [Leptolyngbyaceae bacterium]
MTQPNDPMVNDPLVSVIIPAYNAEAFIAQTLQSVITQTYRHIEVIVVDDGSQDNTVNLVRQIIASDGRVKLLQQPNGGVAAARNLAITHAQGEFIAPVDADDIWYPANLERQVQCFQQGSPHIGLVYSWSVDIDERGELLGGFRASNIQGNVYNTLICHNFLGNASASMMRRSCLEQVGLYDSELRSQKAQGCEDWDLYLRIASQYEFAVVPELLVGYRKLTTSMSCDYHQMARSHTLVMDRVQQQHPQLSRLLFQLSASNLYMYFAQQSVRCGQFSTGFYWVRQAFKANWPIATLYVGMVTLIAGFVRNGIYRLVRQAVDSVIRKIRPATVTPASPPPPSRVITLAELQQRTQAIALTLKIGEMFHWVVSRLAPPVKPAAPVLADQSQEATS